MKPVVVKIFSENADFQVIETLQRNRSKRAKTGEFFVEGVRAINQALLHGWQPTAWVYSREKRLSDWAENILARSTARKHFEMPLALLAKLSQKEDTSELLALFAIPENDLARIPVRENPFLVLLDRPASPGNLGTIIRSCDALGVDGLVITGHSADLYDPETIRATTGSFFAVPAVVLPSHKELFPWLESLRQRFPGLQLIGTSAKARIALREHDFTRPTVLAIGNETHGLSEGYRQICDVMVTIPMFGSASSLNVASAASILMYEVTRQRSFSNSPRPA